MSAEMEVDPEFLSPRTPPPENRKGDELEDEKGENQDDSVEDGLLNSGGKGRRKHRRSKGKKRKQQKSQLLITNEDGTDFNPSNSAPGAKQSKVIQLRPTNNPLINAPRNSTQFIIDDHENSNLFWNFDAQGPNHNEREDGDTVAVEAAGQLGAADNERFSPDDENFWTEYSERDFEDVYETAHREEIYGWEREKIVREIAGMEGRQKQLIELLAAVDPVVYLEKLQQELLSLQEVNRELKLVNIAEKLYRREREEREGRGDSDSDSRLPDSTSQEGEHRDKKDEEEEEEDGEGGCLSGCCLRQPCDESCQFNQDQNLADVEEEDEEDDMELEHHQEQGLQQDETPRLPDQDEPDCTAAEEDNSPDPITSQANIVITHKPTTSSAGSVTHDIAGSSQDIIVGHHNTMSPENCTQEAKSEATNDCQTNSSSALQPESRSEVGHETTEKSSEDKDESPSN